MGQLYGNSAQEGCMPQLYEQARHKSSRKIAHSQLKTFLPNIAWKTAHMRDTNAIKLFQQF